MRFNNDAFRVALAVANKTQRQVAEECGIHEVTVTRIKAGMDIKVSLAVKLARVVGVAVEDLWEEADP